MKLKIPPVMIVGVCIVLMWSLSMLKVYTIGFQGQDTIAMISFVLSMALTLPAVGFFKKHKTTIDPTRPHRATRLVRTGVYKISRNPMYLGMLFFLLGIALMMGNVLNMLFVILYLWYMDKFQIRPEEEALTKIFGEEYRDYCTKVRRWI